MKKIILAINDLGIGGAERLLVELATRLDPAQFECHVVTLFTNPSQNLLAELPQRVQVHQFAFTSGRDIASWRSLYTTLKHIRPDVVVSNLIFTNTVLRVLKPFVGYAAIACEHNTYTGKTLFQRIVDRFLARLSYRIVAVSETVATFTAAQEGIPREKFEVIRNGVDLKKIEAACRGLPEKDELKADLGVAKAEPLLLTVGRLMPQKNQMLLLRGFALFHKKFPQSVLAVVGEGWMRPALEAETHDLGLEGAVIFFGIQRNVERFYKAADLFVLTSDIEGFSLVCVEAMACGLPVVSTKTAGPDEFVKEGNNGYFISESSPAAVSEALERGIDHLADLRPGTREAAARYDIEKMVHAYAALIAEAAG